MLYSQIYLVLFVVIPLACFAKTNFGNTSCFPVYTDNEDQWFTESTQDNGVFNEIRVVKAKRGINTKQDSSRKKYFSYYKKDLEAAINKQINIELFAHYTYLSMAYHFDHNSIKMEGFHKFFLKMAQEEHEHAQMLMKYQNKRGGRVRLQPIQNPCKDGIWGSGLEAMRAALDLEIAVNSALLHLHLVGQDDAQFLDFLESNFLGEQVESIKELNDYVNTLQRMNSALGEYHFDHMTLQGKK